MVNIVALEWFRCCCYGRLSMKTSGFLFHWLNGYKKVNRRILADKVCALPVQIEVSITFRWNAVLNCVLNESNFRFNKFFDSDFTMQ